MRSWRTGILPVHMNRGVVGCVLRTHSIFWPTIGGAWNAPYITVAVFDIFYNHGIYG